MSAPAQDTTSPKAAKADVKNGAQFVQGATPKPIVQDAHTSEHVPQDSAPTEGSMPDGKHRYLLCLDYSEEETSAKALAYCRDRLCVAGDEVVLLQVLPYPLVDPAFDAYAPMLYSWDNEREYIKTIERKALEALRQKAKDFPTGVEVLIHLRHGFSSDEIIKGARYHKSDMIILGRRKLKFYQRLVSSGSVSTALINHFDGSLLIVR